MKKSLKRQNGRNEHDVRSSRGKQPRHKLLLRLFCASLAIMVAVSAVTLLRDIAGRNVFTAWADDDPEDLAVGIGDTMTLDGNKRCRKVSIYLGAKLIIPQDYTMELVKDDKLFNMINLESNATLNVHGKLTGRISKLSFPSGNLVTSSFNIYLSHGAIFDAIIDERLNGKGKITYWGYNAACDEGGTISVTTTGQGTGGTQVDAGTIGTEDSNPYLFTATPPEGSFVVWTRGEDGEVIGSGPTIELTCVENAKYKLYAHFQSHTYDTTWTWSDDNSEATVVFQCTDPDCPDSSVNGLSPATVTPETIEATCTSGKITRYTASAEKDSKIYTNVKEVPVEGSEPLGHDWGEWETITEATETTNGQKQHTCKRCGETETEEISATGGGTGTGDGTGTGGDTYIFTDDSQFTWTKGSTNGMLVIVKNSTGDDSQTLSRLSKVLVDGNELTSDKYTAREGSIILTLKESYLKGLKTGEHLLRIELSDGKVTEHKFTVYSSGGSDVKSPGTGESDKAVRLSLALMLLSVYGAGWALTRKKKRRRKVSAYSHR